MLIGSNWENGSFRRKELEQEVLCGALRYCAVLFQPLLQPASSAFFFSSFFSSSHA
jgi:hypothetical protein